MEDYAEGWKKLVRRGVTSYLEVLKNLQGAKQYHGSRSRSPFDDGGGGSGFKIEIPLLWGTF